MSSERFRFLFLNIGHFIDHYLLLIFATVAALRLSGEWGLSYTELIPYATPGFVAFGVCAIPAGWLADKWSREGMMTVFFFGIGASAVLASQAQTPLQMSLCLGILGIFAAIYHPVGLAMVVQGHAKTGMRLAVNGVFGNMGVACAALMTGWLMDVVHWRAAFVIPGILSIGIGIGYWIFNSKIYRLEDRHPENVAQKSAGSGIPKATVPVVARVFAVIFFTTAIGGLIFQSTTFALPKIFDERIGSETASATLVGGYAFIVFAIAAFGQVVVGFLVDRMAIKVVFAMVALLQAIFFLLMINLTGIPALFVAIAFMLAVFGQIPINDVLVGRMAKSEWRSRAYAIRYIVTFSVMASAVPLIGWIVGNYGFDMLFKVLVLAASLVFLATLSLPMLAPTRQR